MKNILSRCGIAAAISIVLVPGVGTADWDPHEGCSKTFTDTSYGSSQFRDECREELGRRRAELAAWGVDPAGMSSAEAWDRHGAESQVRQQAREDQARRDSLERDRLATERAKADAENQRIAAERDREAQQYAAAQMQAGQQMMQEQNQMMKGLGVNLGNPSVSHKDCDDDDYTAYELNMYQSMIDNGVAAHCNGKTCADLVDCVDEALGED